MIKLIECPRDAMQGIKTFIPTKAKADYINSLLQVGFDTIDFGSFVSPKAIPQLSDTNEVIKLLDLSNTNTRLLAIIGNTKGAKDAVEFEEISYLGFPFSISNTFLELNIKSNYQKALSEIAAIQNLAVSKKREMVVYLSMAFGNPYGDAYSEDSLLSAIQELEELGIKIINLADTVGVGDASQIGVVFKKVITTFSSLEIGFHLHTSPETYLDKIDEAYQNGCRRFDSVMGGLGGCPMSAQKLVGNLSTENLLNYFAKNNIELALDDNQYHVVQKQANILFSD